MYKVLQVFTSLDRGGAETFIMNIYKNLNRNKFSFDFVVHTQKHCDYEDEIIKLGGEIFRLPPRNQGIFAYKKSWEEFLKIHNNYDIIHFHKSCFSDIVPLKVAYKNRIKKIITHSHSTSVDSVVHQILHLFNRKFIYKYVTDYCACSIEAGKWLYGEETDKEVNVISNGVDAKKFRYNDKIRTSIRNKEKIQNKFVVGHVGRFVKVKNHEFLIDIFLKIKEKKSNAVLLLVGQGELEQMIRLKVKEYGLEDSVIFAGLRTDIYELMQAMDVFILPSLYEGLPVTLIEAQSAGLKCFVSENVSKQVKITPLINFLPIVAGCDYWAKIVCQENSYDHSDTYNLIYNAGFDIESVVKKLEDIYLS